MEQPSNLLELRSKKLNKEFSETAQTFEKVQFETIIARRRFFENLTLLNGGAIVLSVTFLGYLSSKIHSGIVVKPVLYLAWATLLLSMFSCLSQIWTNQNHVYFVWASEYHRRKTDLQDLKIEVMSDLSVRVIGSSDQPLSEAERIESVGNLRAEKERLVKETDRLRHLGRRGLVFSKTVGRIALLSFSVGLLALVGFAVANSR